MSKGYYIYLDRRDVGKGDVCFFGWLYGTDEEYEYTEIPVRCNKNVPIFSPAGNRIEFREKDKAEKTVKQIIKRFPELKGLLHVETCEEATIND